MRDMMANVSHTHEKEQAKSNTGDDGYKCNSEKSHKGYNTDFTWILFSSIQIYLMTST
jgi:hypothetical protein